MADSTVAFITRELFKGLTHEGQGYLTDQLRSLLSAETQDEELKKKISGMRFEDLVGLCRNRPADAPDLLERMEQARAFIPKSSSDEKPKRQPAPYRTIAIICVKEHEYNALSALIQQFVLTKKLPKLNVAKTSIQKWTSGWCTNEDVYHFEPSEKSPEFKLVLVCYGQNQGPVVTASRVGHLVTEYNPDMVGMTGICGGRILGTVYVAFNAICPEFGHVESQSDLASGGQGHLLSALQTSRNPGYYYVPKEGGRWKAESCVNPTDLANFQYQNILSQIKKELVPSIVDFKISDGTTLYSYNQVRNDCEEELISLTPGKLLSHDPELDPESAIEMEAQAMFHALSLLNVKALPVIKAVSDVGQRQMPHQTNANQFKKYCGDSVMGHTAMRKQYRKHAAENAAQVMIAFIRRVIETKEFVKLRKVQR